MKRLLTGILIAALLSGYTGLIQLAKIPVLVQHFLEHKAENKDISFGKFLALHYSADSKHNDARHAQLPFKSSGTAVTAAVPVIVQHNTAEAEFLFCVHTVHFPEWHSSFVASSKLCDIWQPPRQA